MARRKLPPSEVLASTKDESMLPHRKPTNQARPHGMADELNAQRERPVYDEFRKRRDYRVGKD